MRGDLSTNLGLSTFCVYTSCTMAANFFLDLALKVSNNLQRWPPMLESGCSKGIGDEGRFIAKLGSLYFLCILLAQR